MIRILLLSFVSLSFTVSASSMEPNQLADNIGLIALLSEDHILCEARTESRTGLYTLDLNTCDMAPWEPDWSPEEDGWNAGGYWDLDVSPDGEWVLVARVLYVSEDFEYFMPGREAVGLILCRPDGSEAMGIALGWSPAGGSMPMFSFTSDSRLVVGNDIVCKFTDPETFALEVCDNRTAVAGTIGCFDLESMSFKEMEYPAGERERILFPNFSNSYLVCPWNDRILIFEEDGGYISDYFEFQTLDLTGTFASYTVPDEYRMGLDAYPLAWVSEDAVLFIQGDTLGLLHVNGTFSAFPDSTWDWLVYEILSDSTCIFSRDGGETVEHGLINWENFEVLSSNQRQDLRDFRYSRMTCIGQNRLLLSNEWSTGPLYLTWLEELYWVKSGI